MDRHVCMSSLAHFIGLELCHPRLKNKTNQYLCVDVIFASVCVRAWPCMFALWVWLSAQQKMEPHGLYRPPSEERLSPGQQPPSPCVKGSQRVVTLAQHISVSTLFNCVYVAWATVCSVSRNNYQLLYVISMNLKKTFVVRGFWCLMYARQCCQMCLYGNRRW